ncbi:(2Fe-2S)-binding protein [Ramlibacter rhizophilus]|uniref:(2Fe-2S)-binding protein n=2 Tax=Ramlibacter rhizophilus TaxID=1781167 RepID=A0A4Z0C1Y2_9BURK|nr:(2Fe-2S)-binding protein [Ramlibacter rhizophilus]
MLPRSAFRRLPMPPPAPPSRHAIRLRVNGTPHELEVESWTALLDLLRDHLDLTGTKKGCDHGQCGACTVLVDGVRVLSCLSLAVMHDGREVTTVEGLAHGDQLHPLQEAFMQHDAFQCGYCTPGQLCSAVGLASEGHAKSLDDVRELMSGNLCRCGAYAQIAQAVAQVVLGPGPHASEVARSAWIAGTTVNARGARAGEEPA